MSNFNGIRALLGKFPGKLRVLLAPLDWGLGHATRCIPVICELQEAGHDIWLAGEGAQEELLRARFPGLPFLPLPGYRIKYGRTGTSTSLRIALQAPRIRQAIRDENRWLAKMQQSMQWDLVISDNRFGLHHPDIYCVFITHQLHIIHPWGSLASGLLQKWNFSQIDRFNECWVPDYKHTPGLAGILSHPDRLPRKPVHYIGPLSRLTSIPKVVKPGHIFISLSGPEPQRSLLEEKLIRQIAHYPGTACMLRGLPHDRSRIPSTGSLHFYNHLPDEQYAEEMAKAEWIITRSGYSTIMDLETMGKKAILIPTPGQTEQLYLAELMHKYAKHCFVRQEDFVLNDALQKASMLFNPETVADSGKIN
ncbi:MAG: glycosyltransferase [Chitinophagaceae bacterium]